MRNVNLNYSLQLRMKFYFSDIPILGKISRTRRAKSAHTRNSGKIRVSDKRKLIRDSDSSSTDAVDSFASKLQRPDQPEINTATPVPVTSEYVNAALEMDDDNL